jgi:DNA-binding LacI/PurR family transcriptional regulator
MFAEMRMVMINKLMSVTHQEIADRAGVSRTLVTRALHGTHGARVSEETRQAILKVARELGYQPRSFTTYNIGYVGNSDTLFLAGESRFLLLTDKALRQAGFRLVLTSVDRDGKPVLGDVLNTKTVDGVIFSRWFGSAIHQTLPAKMPWVVLSDEDEIPVTVDKVTMDTVATSQRIATHLIEKGHRHLCILANPSTGNVTTHMHIGIREALAKAGLPEIVSSIEVTADSQIAVPLKVKMRQENAPTAFVTFGAEKTVTLLNILNAYGYRVPQDVSLVSLLDSHLLEPLMPPIMATTAMGPDVAQQAVRRLLEKIENPASPPKHTYIPGELIQRPSVAPMQVKQNF